MVSVTVLGYGFNLDDSCFLSANYLGFGKLFGIEILTSSEFKMVVGTKRNGLMLVASVQFILRDWVNHLGYSPVFKPAAS